MFSAIEFGPPKMALPLTRTFAPAAATWAALKPLMPPSMQMGAGLDVHSEDICAAAGKLFQVAIGLLDHQVYVNDGVVLVDDGRHGAQDGKGEGDAGYEVAIHDVDVDIVAAGFECRGDLFAQAGEVGGEDGGS